MWALQLDSHFLAAFAVNHAHSLGFLVRCLKHPCVILYFSQGCSLKFNVLEETNRKGFCHLIYLCKSVRLIAKASSVVCGKGKVSQECYSVRCARLQTLPSGGALLS